MKKILLFFSLFFSSIIVAYAELCIHISGDGTNIGDEIACGTEHFYVISNDGENIRMMAKYNLLVGRNYYRLEFSESYENGADAYFDKNYQEKLKEGYSNLNFITEYNPETGNYNYNGALLTKNAQNIDSKRNIIFFDTTKKIEEVLRNEEVQKYLNEGYDYSFIRISNGKIIGIEFFKREKSGYVSVILDESVSEKIDIFEDSKVQEYMEKYGFDSCITDSDGKYMGVKFYWDSSYSFKTIAFEREMSKYNMLTQEKSQKEFNEGWAFYKSIGTNNSDILGIVLYKQNGVEFKTIVTYDGGGLPTDLKFYEKESVLNLLAEGYSLNEMIGRGTEGVMMGSGALAGYYVYSTVGATFSKNEYYEYYNVIFYEEISESNLSNYIAKNPEIQEKLAEGYSIGEYYTITKHLGSKKSTYNNYYGVRLDKKIKDEESVSTQESIYGTIHQHEKALGAHDGEAGKPAADEIGVIDETETSGYFIDEYQIYYDGYRDYFYSKDLELYEAYYYLESYKNTLINDGFDIIDVDSITVGEINEIVYNITGEEIPLENWYYEGEGWSENTVTGDEFYILGSIKDLMPEEYSWLWGTTYWTRTADPDFNNIYFIDTLGDLCAAEFCKGVVGAGLRPIVTIKADDVVYKIDTVTDGHGTVKADYVEATSGTVVKFTVEPKEGYVLKEVKVTDANGNIVIFKDYTFTMPDANVIIEATFIKIDNPNTMTYISIIVVIGLMLSGTIFYKSKKRLN